MRNDQSALWIGLFLMAIVAMGPAQAQSPGATLDSVLRYAREHNPELAAMRHEADAAAQRVAPAGALPDPMLRVEMENLSNYNVDMNNVASNTPFAILPARVGMTKYTVVQSLPFWGKRDLKRAIAEADAEQAGSSAVMSWNDLAAKIKTAYVQYFYVVKNENLTREVLELMTRLEELARTRYAGGLATQQDVIRAQIEQTGMRGELIGLGGERQQVQARLNALLARKSTAPLAEPQMLRPLPAMELLSAATLEQRLLAANPQLAGANARLRSAEKSRELTQRNRYPDFSLGVTPVQTGSRVNSWNLMLELNIPLQQESRRAQKREAEAMLSSAQSRQQSATQQLLADLAENIAGIDVARQMEQLIAHNFLPQAELSSQSALAAYENGRTDFTNLLEAQRQIRKAKQDRLKAQVEAQIRLAEIERLLGEDL